MIWTPPNLVVLRYAQDDEARPVQVFMSTYLVFLKISGEGGLSFGGRAHLGWFLEQGLAVEP